MKANRRVPAESEIVWGETPCYYCGLIAIGLDHVPPKIAREKLYQLGFLDRYPLHEVPCCRECNSVLGDRLPWTITERKQFIKKRLRTRYYHLLQIPAWSDTELAVLGPRLQEYVISELIRQEQVRKRIDW